MKVELGTTKANLTWPAGDTATHTSGKRVALAVSVILWWSCA